MPAMHPRCPQRLNKRCWRKTDTGKVPIPCDEHKSRRGKPSKAVASPVRAVAAVCPHRGDVIDHVECPSCCGGRTKIKVYQCSLHGRCTLKPVEGEHCCRG